MLVLGAPRIDARPEMARLGGRAHRELVHVQLAEHDRARIPKVLRDGQLIGRLEAVAGCASTRWCGRPSCSRNP